MGHLQRLSNWNVRRAITRHRTAQLLDAISYYNRARDQSNQPEVYDGILSHLASLAEISELTEGVSMLNVSENAHTFTFHYKFPVPIPSVWRTVS